MNKESFPDLFFKSKYFLTKQGKATKRLIQNNTSLRPFFIVLMTELIIGTWETKPRSKCLADTVKR